MYRKVIRPKIEPNKKTLLVGIVIDGKSYKPLPHAELVIIDLSRGKFENDFQSQKEDGQRCLLDRQGKFSSGPLAPGRYGVVCTCSGYLTYKMHVMVEDQKTTQLKVLLEKPHLRKFNEPVLLLPMKMEIRKINKQKKSTIAQYTRKESEVFYATRSISYREVEDRSSTVELIPAQNEYWIRWYPDEVQQKKFVGQYTLEEKSEWYEFYNVYIKEKIADGTTLFNAIVESPNLKKAWIKLTTTVDPIRACQMAKNSIQDCEIAGDLIDLSWDFDVVFPFDIPFHFSQELEAGELSENFFLSIEEHLDYDLPHEYTFEESSQGQSWEISFSGAGIILEIEKKTDTNRLVIDCLEVEDPLELFLEQGISIPTLPEAVHLYTIKGINTIPVVTDIAIKREDIKLAVTDIEGSFWLTDFEEAIRVGMGIKITGDDVKKIDDADWLILVGASQNTKSEDVLQDIFKRRNALGELSLMPQNTPTNVVEDKQTNFTELESDPERILQRTNIMLGTSEGEVDIEQEESDLQALEDLFGFSSQIFSNMVGDISADQREAAAMFTLLWPACTCVIPSPFWNTELQKNAQFFKDNLRAAGSFPALRVGKNPYGLLPVLSLGDWQNGVYPQLDIFTRYIKKLKKYFLEIASGFQHLDQHHEKERYARLVEILSNNGVSEKLLVRPVDTENPLALENDIRRLSTLLVKKTSGTGLPIIEGHFPATEYLQNDFTVTNPEFDSRSPVLERLIWRSFQISARYPDQVNQLKEALIVLAEVPPQRLEILLMEYLDMFSHRLDPWLSCVASGLLKEQNMRDTAIGIYGWLEKPGDITEQETLPKYIQAPSLEQAKTAALLRSAAENNDTALGPGAFNINLSSKRIREGSAFLEGLRKGHSAPELLGAEVEKCIRELCKTDDNLDVSDIFELRKIYPLVIQEAVDEEGNPTEIHTIIDGEKFLSDNNNPDYEPVRLHVNGILDAASDITVFEAGKQAVTGNFARLGGWFDFQDGKCPPPTLDSIHSNRTGDIHGTKIFFPVICDTPIRDDEEINPRVIADPLLNNLCQTIMPDFATKHIRVRYRLPEQQEENVIILLPVDLDLEPIDLVIGGLKCIELRARYYILKLWQDFDPLADPRHPFITLGSFPRFTAAESMANSLIINIENYEALTGDTTSIIKYLKIAEALRMLLHRNQSVNGSGFVSPFEFPLISESNYNSIDLVKTVELLLERFKKLCLLLNTALIEFTTFSMTLKLKHLTYKRLIRRRKTLKRLLGLKETGTIEEQAEVDTNLATLFIKLALLVDTAALIGDLTDFNPDTLQTEYDSSPNQLVFLKDFLSQLEGIITEYEISLIDETKSLLNNNQWQALLKKLSAFGIENALLPLPSIPNIDEVQQVQKYYDDLILNLAHKIEGSGGPESQIDYGVALCNVYLFPGRSELSLSIPALEDKISVLSEDLSISHQQAALIVSSASSDLLALFDTLKTGLAGEPALSCETKIQALRTVSDASSPSEIWQAFSALGSVEAEEITSPILATTSDSGDWSFSLEQTCYLYPILFEINDYDNNKTVEYLRTSIESLAQELVSLLQKATDKEASPIIMPYFLKNEDASTPTWNFDFSQAAVSDQDTLLKYSSVRPFVSQLRNIFINERELGCYYEKTQQQPDENDQFLHPEGTFDHLYISKTQTVTGDTFACFLIDEFIEGFPNPTETTGVALHYPTPQTEAPHALLWAVFPPSIDENAEWNSDLWARTLMETIELLKVRAVSAEQIQRSNGVYYYMPNPVYYPLPDGKPLFPYSRMLHAIYGEGYVYINADELTTSELEGTHNIGIRNLNTELEGEE